MVRKNLGMLQQFYGTASQMNLEGQIILGNFNHYLQIGMEKTVNAIYAGSCSMDLSAAMLVLCF